MHKSIRYFMLVCWVFSWNLVFAQDWTAALKSQFEVVETFNDMADWDGTGSSSVTGYGDVRTASQMPIYENGSPTQWQYYSLWSTAKTPSFQWIADHGVDWTWNPKSETVSKSLCIDFNGVRGPTRAARDLRDAGNGNGFKWSDGIRVFFMIKRSTGFWSKFSAYSKLCVLNMECNAGSCNSGGANYAVAPYFDYHTTYDSAGGPRMTTLISNNHGYIPDSTSLDWSKYDNRWIGLELLYQQDAANRKCLLSVWMYDENGNLIAQLNNRSSNPTAFSASEWSSVAGAYFDNFMFGGNMSSASPNSYMYLDDLIIDSDKKGPIAARYFNLIKSGAPANPPPTPSAPTAPKGVVIGK